MVVTFDPVNIDFILYMIKDIIRKTVFFGTLLLLSDNPKHASVFSKRNAKVESSTLSQSLLSLLNHNPRFIIP